MSCAHSLFHATFPWIGGELLWQCLAEELSDSYPVINSKFYLTWPGGSSAGICIKRYGSLATQLCQVGTPWDTRLFHKFFRKRFAMAGRTGLFSLPVPGASPSCQVQILWWENFVGHSGWLMHWCFSKQLIWKYRKCQKLQIRSSMTDNFSEAFWSPSGSRTRRNCGWPRRRCGQCSEVMV